MAVNPLQDIMNQYLWCFGSYFIAMLIILLNAARSVYFFLRSKKRPLYPKRGLLDLLISLLCGVSFYMGQMFQGVLADNNVPNLYQWSSYLWLLCLASLALFVVQAVFYIKTPSIRPRPVVTEEIPSLHEESEPKSSTEQDT